MTKPNVVSDGEFVKVFFELFSRSVTAMSVLVDEKQYCFCEDLCQWLF